MRSRTAVPRTALAATTVILLLSAVAGCGEDASGSTGGNGDRLSVVAAFYPLQFISERIGGDVVTVSNLTKPGAEPHDLDLNPRQVGAIVDAGLIVYLKGFQPDIDQAVAGEAADHAFDAAAVEPLLDTATGAHEGDAGHEQETTGKDPHVWLDPTRLATIGDRLATRLGQADPAHAADFTARAAALRAELQNLDQEYAEKLTTCRHREIVTSHSAFNYLAIRYKLSQIGVTGIAPDEEASPQRYAEVAEQAKVHGATTIFFETLVSPKVAETVAREIGAKTAVLDPLEGLTDGGGDYLSVMRTNLTALVTALGCS
jgi:zinc transport system substrate-binding protein